MIIEQQLWLDEDEGVYCRGAGFFYLCGKFVEYYFPNLGLPATITVKCSDGYLPEAVGVNFRHTCTGLRTDLMRGSNLDMLYDTAACVIEKEFKVSEQPKGKKLLWVLVEKAEPIQPSV